MQTDNAYAGHKPYILSTNYFRDGPMADLKKMHILIIDDSQDSIVLAEHILKEEGYENIRSVQSGRQSLDLIMQNPPELILLDIVMPEMNGIEICTALKADPKTAEIPIIMISGSFADSDEALEKAFSAGAIDFIPKPIRPLETLARVKSILSLKQAADRTRYELSMRKALTEKLQEANMHLDNIYNNSLDSIVVADSTGNITRANKAFTDMIGYSQDELIGRSMAALSPTEKGTYTSLTGEEEIIDDAYFDNAKTMIFDHLLAKGLITNWESLLQHKNGTVVPVEHNSFMLYSPEGDVYGSVTIIREITERKKTEKQREQLINDLQKALADVKTLSGLIPICASCKKIRDDKGYWNQIENYIRKHSQADFTHGICPDCARKLYPQIHKDD